jgi:hypothetical protein
MLIFGKEMMDMWRSCASTVCFGSFVATHCISPCQVSINENKCLYYLERMQHIYKESLYASVYMCLYSNFACVLLQMKCAFNGHLGIFLVAIRIQSSIL